MIHNLFIIHMISYCVAVISISLPDALLEQADALLSARGYAGRSELVRAALRDFLAAESRPLDDRLASATVTLLYPHGSERKVADVRHGFTDVVHSMMHGHAETACVELFLLQGEPARVRAFVDALRGLKEALLVQAVPTGPPGG